LSRAATGVDVQIHAKSMAELIGDELRIDTGLTRKTGVSVSTRVLAKCGFEHAGVKSQTP